MTPVIKISSAFAILGTASATGIYFGTDLFKSKKTIADLMKSKHPQKRLISVSNINDSDWKKAYKIYREDNKGNDKGSDIGRLKDWTKPSDVSQETATTEEFISKCNSNKSVEVYEDQDPLYKQVLKYCTRDTLVKDLILENTSKKLLDSSGDQDAGGWTSAWGVYKQENDVSGKEKDTGEFNDWSNKKGGTELPADYKTKCDAKAKVPVFRLDSDDYKNVLAGCTKD